MNCASHIKSTGAVQPLELSGTRRIGQEIRRSFLRGGRRPDRLAHVFVGPILQRQHGGRAAAPFNQKAD